MTCSATNDNLHHLNDDGMDKLAPVLPVTMAVADVWWGLA